ncbi:MAG: hypothetical protein RI922_1011 [Bacteroidota bacterium]|jgi:putative transposase
METIKKFDIGDECKLRDKLFTIEKFVTNDKVLIKSLENGNIESAYVRNLSCIDSEKDNSKVLDSISDQDWLEAQKRLSILQDLNALLSNDLSILIADATVMIAEKHGISARTIYRWKKLFDKTQRVSALVPNKSSGGRGKGRISNEQAAMISLVLDTFHFTQLRPKTFLTYRELEIRCRKAGIETPSLNTLRSRISKESLKKNIAKRHGKSIANHKFDAVPGKYPQTNWPLEVVQIDHTPLDIIVLGDDRKPLGRPWLTLAIDVYSRMVTGAYLSFDTPGFLGTGICIANSILPKDNLVRKYNLKSEWPIQGRLQNIHSDNAPEFKSKSLLMACQEYGININYRGKGKTHWGGHIERLLGNFLSEIHSIPGTTFSNPTKRESYNSNKEAVLTLSELERWLHVFIVDVYHNKVHSGIKMSPLAKYLEGVHSLNVKLPTGIGSFNYDPIKVKLDFLPAEERTVQRTGVQIDHIRYFADVLRPYIYLNNPNDDLSVTKRRTPAKLVFKRDPRDISCIYFLEPRQQKYFPIYYADASRPPISIWEHREALKELKRKGGIDKVTEDKIFEAYDDLKNIVEDARHAKKLSLKKERQQRSDEHLQGFKIEATENISKSEAIDDDIDFDNIQIFTYTEEL